MSGKLTFPKFLLNKQVQIYRTSLGEDGEEEVLLYDGMCIYSEESKQTLDAEKQLITLSGSVIVEGDLLPNELIQGYIKIGNIKRNIYNTCRPRNPDGSVFSTELELI
jgi:hypothetical protein